MRIAVVGAYGVGRTYRVERAPDAGESLVAIASHDDHGGKGSNQAIAAARLGATVSIFTALGDDDAAQRARQLWRAEGIDHDSVVTRSGSTMNGVILVESSGENRIVIAPGALGELTADDVEAFRPNIAAADLLIVSLEVPVDVAIRALRIARDEGVRTLLNPAPATVIDPEHLAHIDFMTPNQTESAMLTGVADPDAALEKLRALTTATIVQTRGADGVAIVTPDGHRVTVPAATPDRVVDTTGAGDSFTAALGVALIAGLPVVEAATWAAAAGARAVQADGVIPALPRIETMPPLAHRDGVPRREDSL